MKINNLFYLILLLLIPLTVVKISKEESKESAFQKEEKLINDYHNEVRSLKKDKYYYIDKEKARILLNPDNFLEFTKTKKGDAVLFFDKQGNVIYQAEVSSRKGSETLIECLDLTSGETYITDLDSRSVKDLNPNYKYIIKFYRNNPR